jgi:hypothetical protein
VAAAAGVGLIIRRVPLLALAGRVGKKRLFGRRAGRVAAALRAVSMPELAIMPLLETVLDVVVVVQEGRMAVVGVETV